MAILTVRLSDAEERLLAQRITPRRDEKGQLRS